MYKDCEIGSIPTNWNIQKLEELANVTGGKRLPKGSSLSEINNGHPYIRVSDMNDKGIQLDSMLYVPDDVVEQISRYRVDKDDLYISVAGTLGLVGKVPDELNGANLTENADRISNIRCNTDFLLYCLKSDFIKKIINSEMTTNAQPKLALTRIKQFPIPVPPLKEQQKIAEILSSVDAAIEKTEQVIAKTEEVKKGLMQQLLTKGIGHTEFKQTEIGEIPVEWELIKIQKLLDLGILDSIQDGNHGEKHPKSSDYCDEGIPFIMANDLINGDIDFAKCKKIPKSIADNLRIGFSRENDILLTHKATIGKVAIVPNIKDYVMLTPQVTYYRIKKQENLIPSFLKYYFESSKFQKELEVMSKQSTRSYIGITNQKKLSILLPSIEEQTSIVEILDTIVLKQKKEENKLQQLKIIKNGLMQQLLTGQVRIKID